MQPIIISVEPKENRILLVTFADGEIIRFDVDELMEKHEAFKQLLDEGLFRQVRIDGMGYGVSWNDDLDLSSEGIYLHGEHIGKTDPDMRIVFALAVARYREERGFSQRELSRRSGIIHADICKIEQGRGNPTLLTMQRLAKALGTDLASLLTL